MGGPWRDRPPALGPGRWIDDPPHAVDGMSPRWADPTHAHVVAAAFVLGAIVGAGALVLVAPYLPFVEVLR